MHRALVALAAALVAGCASVPPELPAVQGFELDRYLGRWYEIARLDHRFERGLTHVTADYRLREDGQVSVRNCGFKAAEQGWSTASGRARLLTANGSAQLAVSFFWPFESGYTVVALDADYRHSMVAGGLPEMS